MGLLMVHTSFWDLFQNFNGLQSYVTDCKAMSINTDILELLILRQKNFKPSHFHGVIKMGNICFMLERKSFSDLQSSEVFGDILFD